MTTMAFIREFEKKEDFAGATLFALAAIAAAVAMPAFKGLAIAAAALGTCFILVGLFCVRKEPKAIYGATLIALGWGLLIAAATSFFGLSEPIPAWAAFAFVSGLFAMGLMVNKRTEKYLLFLAMGIALGFLAFAVGSGSWTAAGFFAFFVAALSTNGLIDERPESFTWNGAFHNNTRLFTFRWL